MKVTVVTPTLNAAEYLEGCILSVRANKDPGVQIEHLIVDSGSTDGTLDLAQRYDLKVLQVEPVSLTHKINLGIRVALDSSVIGFLGADDTMAPGTAEFLLRWYPKRKSTWLVGGAQWVDATGGSLGTYHAPPTWLTARVFSSLRWSCIPSQSTFCTPEFFEENGYFDTSFEFSADYELFARALTRRRFDRSSRVLSTIMIHADQMSMTPDPTRKAEEERIMSTYAPDSRSVRWLYRYLLKVRLNAGSPVWFYKKRVSGLFSRASVKSRGAAN